ncbi:MAG: hypothetical protein JST43_11945 [Bacteroidetes bacterium]|nr:hypothetical protein [Bacteroidota bacterium]MBS1541354.1 hypothetical protein [Bacteroidota bacterium]
MKALVLLMICVATSIYVKAQLSLPNKVAPNIFGQLQKTDFGFMHKFPLRDLKDSIQSLTKNQYDIGKRLGAIFYPMPVCKPTGNFTLLIGLALSNDPMPCVGKKD